MKTYSPEMRKTILNEVERMRRLYQSLASGAEALSTVVGSPEQLKFYESKRGLKVTPCIESAQASAYFKLVEDRDFNNAMVDVMDDMVSKFGGGR